MQEARRHDPDPVRHHAAVATLKACAGHEAGQHDKHSSDAENMMDEGVLAGEPSGLEH